MNFVKNEILRMWILWKVRFWNCEFLDNLRIFAPMCRQKIQDWNISHNNFSILAFPMIFSKNVFSMRWALEKRKLAKSIKSRPNLVVLLGELDSMWFRSIAKAWSWRFSTWVVSFNPVVSEKKETRWKITSLWFQILFRFV